MRGRNPFLLLRLRTSLAALCLAYIKALALTAPLTEGKVRVRATTATTQPGVIFQDVEFVVQLERLEQPRELRSYLPGS